MEILEETWLILLTQKWNSLGWPRQNLCSLGFGTLFSNTTLFLFFHKHHTAYKNTVHQGICMLCLAVLKLFILSQFTKFSLKEFMWGRGTPNLHHKSRTTSQSQSRCTIVSLYRLHIEQALSQLIPLAASSLFTSMLPCTHRQRKHIIFGRISNFQIHCSWKWFSVYSGWLANW